ncbi:hypothetical protein AGMMS49975_04840 [Clostridia bacterium]|nr:hypothetical protein AGMMS49975_04840 [Clostridia bacterium]
MTSFQTTLSLLSEILAQKKSALLQILNICENQETVLLGTLAPDETYSFFGGMNAEKQTLIDSVIQSDEMFSRMFEKVRGIFDENAKENKDNITLLQAEIKETMEIDIKIRLQEEKNKMYLSKLKQSAKIDMPKKPKAYILEQYKKNSERP